MEPLFHKPKTAPEWNESYYFVFFDKKQNLGGMTRIGFKPNKKEGTTFLILFLPNGSAALYQYKQRIADRSAGERMKVGTVVHQSTSETSWKYGFQGTMYVAGSFEDSTGIPGRSEPPLGELEVTLGLSFTPINDVYEYSKHMTAESRELGRKAGDAHWEQIGKINGSITVGDSTFSIRETMGQRDHSHGVRDWTGIGDWLYYVVWFNENLAVNPAAITAEDGRVSTGGFIFENGKNIPIKTICVLNQKFRNGVFPLSSKLELIDEFDRRHLLEGKADSIVPIPFTDKDGRLSILAQAFGAFKLDSISGGYGSFETLRKAGPP